MAKNIRISDSLYRLAQLEAQLENRSLAQQVEYWAKLGMAALCATPDAGRADLSLASALLATRRSDILDVESGKHSPGDMHFIPASAARECKVIGPRAYRKSAGG